MDTKVTDFCDALYGYCLTQLEEKWSELSPRQQGDIASRTAAYAQSVMHATLLGGRLEDQAK